MKVLLIGSDREIVHMTAKILHRNQYEVTAAIGRSEAADLLRCRRFDLVIMDCDMHASERCSIIKTVKQTADAPKLILISGDREDEVPLLKAGADDWVQKPYQMNVLLARMAALLRQQTTIS